MDSGEKFGRDLGERIKSRVNDRIRNGGYHGGGRYNGMIPGAVILAIGAIFCSTTWASSTPAISSSSGPCF